MNSRSLSFLTNTKGIICVEFYPRKILPEKIELENENKDLQLLIDTDLVGLDD